jgi:hypothetical protein
MKLKLHCKTCEKTSEPARAVKVEEFWEHKEALHTVDRILARTMFSVDEFDIGLFVLEHKDHEVVQKKEYED